MTDDSYRECIEDYCHNERPLRCNWDTMSDERASEVSARHHRCRRCYERWASGLPPIAEETPDGFVRNRRGELIPVVQWRRCEKCNERPKSVRDRWPGPVTGVTLCGECWRRLRAWLLTDRHGELETAAVTRWLIPDRPRVAHRRSSQA